MTCEWVSFHTQHVSYKPNLTSRLHNLVTAIGHLSKQSSKMCLIWLSHCPRSHHKDIAFAGYWRPKQLIQGEVNCGRQNTSHRENEHCTQMVFWLIQTKRDANEKCKGQKTQHVTHAGHQITLPYSTTVAQAVLPFRVSVCHVKGLSWLDGPDIVVPFQRPRSHNDGDVEKECPTGKPQQQSRLSLDIVRPFCKTKCQKANGHECARQH